MLDMRSLRNNEEMLLEVRTQQSGRVLFEILQQGRTIFDGLLTPSVDPKIRTTALDTVVKLATLVSDE
uniref:Uncharacterized protein n=1 Tax=Parascaris equorum TaxID=6256 RepID=A0A914RIB5_PAREQ